jgi:hypothetical protein
VLDAAGLAGEDPFFELAMEDLTQAADLLRAIFVYRNRDWHLTNR